MNKLCTVCEQVMNKRESTPLASPLIEKISPLPEPLHHAGACEGARAGAREIAGKGKGEVGLRHFDFGKGKAVKVTRQFILNPEISEGHFSDPVQVALIALKIPQIGHTEDGRIFNHARIMRWYIRAIGEDCFRELVYQQWRENAIDGEPRSRAAAFMSKLYAALNGGAK